MDTYDKELFAEIRKAFGEDADAIIMEIIFGASVDAAIQKMFID